MRSKFFVLFIGVLTTILLIGCSTEIIPASDETISLNAIVGITAPVTGAEPVTTLDASQYTGTINWTPEVSETFVVGIAYTATITLTPKPGFTLKGTATNSFTVSGATATNAAGSGVVSAAFPATTVVTVYLTAIPGIAVPATGIAPVTRLDTKQYKGFISWNPAINGTFAPETDYMATITLTPKDGFIFAGVAANSFTVAGATATNAFDSNVVSAVFPKTSVLKLISVPAGRFQRDNVASNVSTVSAFRMSECEITRAQFKDIMDGRDPTGVNFSAGINGPVQCVTWYMAIAFCNKLSIAEGLDPVYSISGVNFDVVSYDNVPKGNNMTWDNVTANWNNNGYRLPTDTEWKWAAMGAPVTGQNGSTDTQSYIKYYAGGTVAYGTTNIEFYAWYDENSGNQSHIVGQKIPNELGFYDMTGNIEEWCWDWETFTYPNGLLVDYRGGMGDDSSFRIANGGNFYDSMLLCNTMFRMSFSPSQVYQGLGLRVVRQ